MSTLAVDAIVDSSNGNTATINGATPTVYNTMGKNRIINGAMEIDQRNAGASVTPSTSGNTYCVDRWTWGVTQASKLTAQRSTTAPSGFINSLLVTSSSAYSVTAGDVFGLIQRIEGFNVADLGWGTASASPVTLSFWVRSSLTGTFGGSFINSTANRSYPFTYTINTADTWEQKSVTVSGDTTGTWVTDNGNGIQITFSMGSGSTFNGTAGAWSGNTYYSVTGTTSVVGTSGATFYITGVQLEVGSTATEFERRPYGTELQLCKRYFQKIGSNGGRFSSVGSVWSSNQTQVPIPLITTMRSSPSTTFVTATTTWVLNNGANAGTCSALSTNASSPESVWVTATTGATLATASCATFYEQASTGASVIHFSAEL